ncbi:TolA protein [Xanthomonas phage Xp12]|uniref:TolA protein n=1 Tax=Xanthomonas phage Xp12 TaxID=2746072 RepID=A0A7G9UT64_9CAUD|nr:TolA protein [Xanthomonas phage Xp12]QNN97219.1 TolA protein [Xanthomonas phage Xp12]
MSEDTSTQTSGEATENTKEQAPKAPGVGEIAKGLIRDGKTNEEVLAAIREQFPEAKTSMASINWYRNKLRSDGEKVPTARELKGDAKAEAKAKKDAEKQAKKEAAEKAKAEKKAAKDAEKQAKKEAADKAKAEAKAQKEADAQRGESAGDKGIFE